MYIPAQFREDNRDVLHETMRQNSFALLVTTADNRPFVTHLPIILDGEAGPNGILRAHIARANPQWQHFEAGHEALVVFSGPHAYISPSYYEVSPAVPTWNYVAIHAYGVPRIMSAEELRQLLFDTTDFYENGRESRWTPDFPDGYMEKMMASIVGFSIEITRLEGKSKLSQNRSKADQNGVIAGLEQSENAGDAALAAAMRRHE